MCILFRRTRQVPENVMPRDCALEPELSRKTGKPKAGRGGPLPVFRGEAYRLLDYRGGFPTADEQGWNTLKALAAAELRCGVSKATARLIVGCLGDWFLEEEDLDWLVEQASRLRRIGPGIGKMMGMTRAEQVACGATHLHSTDGPSASERRKEDGKGGDASGVWPRPLSVALPPGRMDARGRPTP